MSRERVQDDEEFSTAVDLLRPYVQMGNRLPLHYTLPTGRTIEALCGRLHNRVNGVPLDVGERIGYLANKLAVSMPSTVSYHTYSLVLKEIAYRLTLPFDQRYAPIWSPR
jgi:hypothetical protein